MTSLFHHPALWCALALLLLFAANLYVFLRRDWEESLYPTNYARLYYPLDIPTIRRWKVERSDLLCLDLAWNKAPENWQLFVDGKPAQVLPGAALRIPLTGPQFDGSTSAPIEEFEHRYTLRPLPEGTGPDLSFSIVAISREYYVTRGMHIPKDQVLIHTNIPAGDFTRHPISYWVDAYRYIGNDALAAADRVVRDQMGVQDSDDTLTRMDKVMRFLRAKLADAVGVPKDAFRWLDPWRMFQDMANGSSKGWCTQNAQIYTFFAVRAGVPTRFVFGANTLDNVIAYNGHSWAESWVEEQGRWTYVDPSHTVIAVQDRNGAFLNTADIMHLCEHEVFEGVTARIMKDWHWRDLTVEARPGTAVNVPFALVNLLPRTHLNRQSIIKYRRPPNVEDTRHIYSMLLKNPTFTWVNFKRYLFTPTLAYSKLPTNGGRTYGVRWSLFAGLVVALILFVASLG